MDKVKYYEAQLDKELSKYPVIIKLEKVTTVPKNYLFIGISLLVGLFTFFNLGGAFITNIVGWVFPAYFSLKALETKGKDDDVQWLTYWCVFGLLTTVEFLSPVVLYLLPFYYFFKLILILYLSLPNFRGAEKIYRSTLRPAFLKVDSTVDDLVNDKTTINNVVKEMRASAEEAATKLEKSAVQAAGAASQKVTSAYQNAKESVTSAAGAASEKVSTAVETVKESVSGAAAVTTEKAAEVAEAAKESVSQAVETAKETVTVSAEAAAAQADIAYEAAKDTAYSAAGKAEAAKETVKEGVNEAANKASETVDDAKKAIGESVAEVEELESKKDL